jgi:hypothetical protein
MPQVLAIADADRIHDYVFSPHELKMIRGGSSLQSRLNRRDMQRSIRARGGTKIYVGGGTALARFPSSERAGLFCRDIAEAFRHQTDIATVTTACVDYPDGQFLETRDRLRTALEICKNGKRDHHFSGSRPFWVTCQACGQHPASTPNQALDKLICRGCRIREDSSKKSAYYPEGCRLPKDFEHIAARSSPPGYLAIAYIDVDRLGRFLADHATNEKTFRHLSTAIDKAVTESAKTVLARMLIFQEVRDDTPFSQAYYEILLAGGDDAIVALPAQYIFQFLRAFQNTYRRIFNRLTRRHGEPTTSAPTFSAGVVFANHHFPIAGFLRRAGERLKSAKRSWPQRDAVDFEVVTSSPAAAYVPESALQPTARPYALEEFLLFAEKAAELKGDGAPSRKIHDLYTIAYEPEFQAQLQYWFLLSRLESTHREKLRAILETGGPDGDFWRRLEGAPNRATRAADLAELWDFLP